MEIQTLIKCLDNHKGDIETRNYNLIKQLIGEDYFLNLYDLQDYIKGSI